MLKSARAGLVLLGVGAALLTALSAAAGPEPKTRTFRVTYRATVRDLPAGARSLDLWLPYPQSSTGQEIGAVTIHAPGAVTIAREPEHGNEAVYFHLDRPQGPVTLTLDVTATRREYAGEDQELSAEEASRYLGPEPLVPVDGPVKNLALEATRGKKGDAARARAIYERVTSLLKYDKSGTGWGRGDALFACDTKRGNCTDFHALIIGMARSQGIPARFAIGLPLPEARGTGEIPGYHCWAELYLKGRGWVPVDSSEAAKALARGDRSRKEYYYGHLDENRIEFSRGRNLTLAPAQQAGPLNYFVYPYAEVDGKRHAGIDARFSFADLPLDPVNGRP
jgi:transglutaminase-like putative cysteine protease